MRDLQTVFTRFLRMKNQNDVLKENLTFFNSSSIDFNPRISSLDCSCCFLNSSFSSKRCSICFSADILYSASSSLAFKRRSRSSVIFCYKHEWIEIEIEIELK